MNEDPEEKSLVMLMRLSKEIIREVVKTQNCMNELNSTDGRLLFVSNTFLGNNIIHDIKQVLSNNNTISKSSESRNIIKIFWIQIYSEIFEKYLKRNFNKYILAFKI